MADSRSLLFQGRGVTDTMYDRWRTHRHIAQGSEAASSDFRPTGRVFVSRGYMQRFINFRQPGFGTSWRAIWDEKYTWGGMPYQQTKRSPSPAGEERDEDFRGLVELPHVKNISIRNSIDQNGIGTASVTIANVFREEFTGDESFIYHVLREGFFSPYNQGDDDFDVHDRDFFLGLPPTSGMNVNEDGKVLTGLMLPNRRIEIFQGYGDEVQRTFVGLIDSIEVNARSGEMTIEMTDFGRMLTDTTYLSWTVPPNRYEVSFVDWQSVKGTNRKRWQKRYGVHPTATAVTDITHIAGRVYGWAGFHTWNRVQAGRMQGRIGNPEGKGSKLFLPTSEIAGEGFSKGDYFIDGINRIKTMLGYVQHITPDYHTEVRQVAESSEGGTVPGYAHFRDPDAWNDEYSRYAIGVPNFEPMNIWVRRSDKQIEQFLDSEILLDGSIFYDKSPLRKIMYVSGTSHVTRRNAPRNFSYHNPFDLDCGVGGPMWLNLREEFGESMKLSEIEIEVLMRRTMINMMIAYNRGSFTVPGWAGVAINKQVDIFESKSGTWRRFVITGFSHDMELGPNASWTTNVEVANLDNVYIRRLKRQLQKLLGVDLDERYDDVMFQYPKGARTPAWVKKPAQRGT